MARKNKFFKTLSLYFKLPMPFIRIAFLEKRYGNFSVGITKSKYKNKTIIELQYKNPLQRDIIDQMIEKNAWHEIECELDNANRFAGPLLSYSITHQNRFIRIVAPAK